MSAADRACDHQAPAAPRRAAPAEHLGQLDGARALIGRPGVVRLRWPASDRAASDGAREVFLEVASCLGEPWLLVTVPVPADLRSDRDALAGNASRALGAFARVGGELVLRWATPLAALGPEGAEPVVDALVDEVGRLGCAHPAAGAGARAARP